MLIESNLDDRFMPLQLNYTQKLDYPGITKKMARFITCSFFTIKTPNKVGCRVTKPRGF